jgi:small-conductance mechanosensitive channel
MILAAASTALAFPMLQPAQVPTGFALVPGLSVETQTNLFLSVLVVLLLFFARRGMLALVVRRVEDSALRYRWAKVSATVAFILAALLLFQIWFTAIRSLGTFLGLVSAGLAIALRDPVADFAGWVFIMWRRPFDLGDRIQIGEFAGDVVDRRIFQFTIMEIGNWVSADQSTGRLIHVPNQMLFTQPLANYVAGFPYLWNELRVLVTFESDWKKAKRLLAELAEDMTVDITREAHAPTERREQRFLIHYRKLTPIVYVSVEDSGVLLTLRYLCRPRERRGTAGHLWERILETFAAAPDVTLAYPTQRINVAREVLATSGTEGPREPPVDARE